jgi:hypothetical protein
MSRAKAATPDDLVVSALKEAMQSATDTPPPTPERRGAGALAEALRSLRPSTALTVEEALAAIRRHDPTSDAHWLDLASRWDGLSFYAFDLEIRSFVIGEDGAARGRGHLLGSRASSTFFGRTDAFSFTLPVRVTVSVRSGRQEVVWSPAAESPR